MAFNLSKNDGAAEEPVVAPKKSKTWIVGLIGALIAAGSIWYYSSSAETLETTKDTSLTSTASISSPVVEEQIAKVDPIAAEQSTAIVTPDDLKVPATFAQGSSTLEGADQKLINRIVIFLTQNPEASIHVDGYASSDGSLEINQELSKSRADVFKKHLVSQNIEESRIIASGKGIENPIASNTSAAGRKKNRRVEVTFSKN